MKIHSGVKPFKCNKCNRAYSQKKSLIDHIKIHKEENETKYLMVSADESMASPSNLLDYSQNTEDINVK